MIRTSKGSFSMINKILNMIDHWKLPSNLLAKVWHEDQKTVSDLKAFAVDNEPSMNHLDWRVIDLFTHDVGANENTGLKEVFSRPVIEIEGFRTSIAKFGIRPADVQASLEKWMTILDRYHIQCVTRKSSPRKSTRTVKEVVLEGAGDAEAAPVSSYDAPVRDRVNIKPQIIKENPGLDRSEFISEEKVEVEPEDLVIAEPQEGIGPYRPVDINNSYHNNFLYYPVQTVIGKRVPTKDGSRVSEKQETVVIRSDRSLQKIVKSDRLLEGDVGQDVYRLTDGTLIHSIPRPNTHGTWQWAYIEKFINGEKVDLEIADTIRLFRKHLMSRVWLPYDEDYTLLALTAVVSFVQSVFESVPLILLVGPAGSGKSELGMVMSEISANSTMIGQVSAATMMRLIDESGGLCIIDDLESVGVSKSKTGKQKFSEIAQVLKVSYKKSTATRMVTNPSTRKTEVMNFFGVKIVSNTSGVDDILGSRMLHVHTRHIDKEILERFQEREGVDEDVIEDTRNRLHNWAFENVGLVNEVYQRLSSRQSDRASEIAEPLYAVAELSGDLEIKESLDRALTLQRQRKNKDRSPEEVLQEVITRLASQGYREIAVTHLVLELRRELDPGYEINHLKEIPGWSRHEWVGRKLREMGVVEVSNSKRKRIKGRNLRILSLKKSFIGNALEKEGRENVPALSYDAFCKECSTCPFSKHACEIKYA